MWAILCANRAEEAWASMALSAARVNLALAEPGFNDRGGFAALGFAFLFVVGLALLLLGACMALGGFLVRRWNKKRGGNIGRGWGWALGFVGGLVVLGIGIQPLVLVGGFLGIMVQQVFYPQ